MRFLGKTVALWLPVLCATITGSRAAVEAVADAMRSIPPYLDSDMGSRWFEFGGDTIVRTDQYIRLTSDQPSQSGWLFSRAPLTATNWEIEVDFSINGAGSIHGDGFAMWITTDRASPGPVFGHKDEFEGLGVFFDTYKNNRPGVVFPYVMAMMGDGQTSYDQNNDGKTNEIGGCSARGLRAASIPTKAKLIYIQDQSLSLQLQYKVEDEWITCFDLEPTESQPLKLPKVVYLGFSAETGEVSDNFDIIQVAARSLYPSDKSGTPKPKKESTTSRKKSGRNKKQSGARRGGGGGGGGWGWFLVKMILFVGVVAGGYVGFVLYRSNRRSRF